VFDIRLTRLEWLRAGAGNLTIKTEKTQRRHRRHGTQEKQNRVLQIYFYRNVNNSQHKHQV